MALKTLEELNRAFLAHNQTHKHKTVFDPIIPLIIEVEVPKTMEPPGTETLKPKDSGTHERKPILKRLNKRSGLHVAMSGILFSFAIVMILFVVLMSGSASGKHNTIFRYAYFTVATSSMQDEIPQGSFILVKQVDPMELEVGENITYMVDQSTSVTHKVVNIYEDYNSSGARGFQTKGVNNTNPDHDIVYEANVVGKVILVLPVVGAVLSNLSKNIFLALIIFGLCMLLSFFLRSVYRLW
jgi:signal peptidase